MPLCEATFDVAVGPVERVEPRKLTPTSITWTHHSNQDHTRAAPCVACHKPDNPLEMHAKVASQENVGRTLKTLNEFWQKGSEQIS